MPVPPHRVECDAPLRLERQLHLVLTLLSLVQHRGRSQKGVNSRGEGLELVHVHSQATQHPPLKRESVCFVTRAGHDGGGSVPLLLQLAYVC